MDEDECRLIESLAPNMLGPIAMLFYPAIRRSIESLVAPPLYCNKLTDKCVQIRLLQKASSLKLSKSFPQSALWGMQSIVTKYTDIMPIPRRPLNLLSRMRGGLCFYIWQLTMIDTYKFKTNSSWSEILFNYCEVMLCAFATKPLKVAQTRFAIQDVNDKTYKNLRHFFARVPVRSMWQGFSLTLLREHLLFFASWNLGPLCVLMNCFLYPIIKSEMRLEAMSSDKNMLPYRYTSFTVMQKIYYEEGILSIFKGAGPFASFVRTKQYIIFFLLTISGANMRTLTPSEEEE